MFSTQYPLSAPRINTNRCNYAMPMDLISGLGTKYIPKSTLRPTVAAVPTILTKPVAAPTHPPPHIHLPGPQVKPNPCPYAYYRYSDKWI